MTGQAEEMTLLVRCQLHRSTCSDPGACSDPCLRSDILTITAGISSHMVSSIRLESSAPALSWGLPVQLAESALQQKVAAKQAVSDDHGVPAGVPAS